MIITKYHPNLFVFHCKNPHFTAIGVYSQLFGVFWVWVSNVHKLSVAIADSCVKRNWISEDDKLWCAYALETKLLSFVFFAFLVPLSVIIGAFKETAIFVCVFHSLRRRLGGWHAPYAWLCQLLSIALVLGNVLFIGPELMKIDFLFLFLSNLVLASVGLIQKPVYPIQTHFDDDVILANNIKKNRFLFCVVTIQSLLGFWFPEVIVYGFLAVFTGLVSVYIEKINQYTEREEKYNEKSRKTL